MAERHTVRYYREDRTLICEWVCPEGTAYIQLVTEVPESEGLSQPLTIADEVAGGTRSLGRQRRQRGAEPRGDSR
jgi:hypothetical protein